MNHKYRKQQQEYFIRVGIFIILAFFSYLFFIKDDLLYWRLLQEQTSKTHDDLLSKQQDKAKFTGLTKHLLHKKQQLAELLQPFQSTSISNLLDSIATLGLESGIKLHAFNYDKEIMRDYIRELPVTIVLEGNYFQIAAFITKLTTAINLEINEFSLTPMHDAKKTDFPLLLNVTASVVTYNAAIELPTAASVFHAAPKLELNYTRNPFQAITSSNHISSGAHVFAEYNLSQLQFVGTMENEHRFWALIKKPDGTISPLKVGDIMSLSLARVITIKSNMLILKQRLDEFGKISNQIINLPLKWTK